MPRKALADASLIGLWRFILVVCLAFSSKLHGEDLFIDKTSTLSALEVKGLSFSQIMGRKSEEQSLGKLPPYITMAQTIASDMGDFQLEERTRLSEKLWKFVESLSPNLLVAAESQMDLIGVVLRPDRVLFSPETCGEIRLIYRLAHTKRIPKHRYPITSILELNLPREKNCKDQWLHYAKHFKQENVEVLTKELGDLAFKQTQIWRWNIQYIRVPQRTNQPELQRNAYLLRSFRVEPNGAIQVERLENTIDTKRLDEERKKSLWQWIAQNQTAIESGVFQIPAQYLAERAVTVTPYAAFRDSNIAIERIFEDKSYALGDDVQKNLVLRRLSSASCHGCHSMRSIAGFHFLGLNSERSDYTVKFSYSNHFFEQLSYRQSFLVDKTTPKSFPFPERPGDSKGESGDHCGLDGNFPDWTCKQGFSCSGLYPKRRVTTIGICLPSEPIEQPGAFCDSELIETAIDSGLDKVTDHKHSNCEPKFCAKAANGFPGGSCIASCRHQEKYPTAECITGVTAKGFSPCLRKGGTIDECRKKYAQQTLYPSCTREKLCRDDYVCMQIGERLQGACVPSYVLEEMTVLGR